MSKGMTEGQKARTRTYLDDFKGSNGGCVICNKKVFEYSFNPDEIDGKANLTIYGSCEGHTMINNSDEILNQAISEIIPKAKEEIIKNPVLMIISFEENGEILKYA